jgi:hypothetical protein
MHDRFHVSGNIPVDNTLLKRLTIGSKRISLPTIINSL